MTDIDIRKIVTLREVVFGTGRRKSSTQGASRRQYAIDAARGVYHQAAAISSRTRRR